MLPLQSQVVQLPFENRAAGFDLFLEGSAALVPELTGFARGRRDHAVVRVIRG